MVRVVSMKADETLAAETELRQRKYLSNVIDPDHRTIKLIKRSGYGFRFDNFQLRCLICWHLDGKLAY